MHDEIEVRCPECKGDGCEDCEYNGTVVMDFPFPDEAA